MQVGGGHGGEAEPRFGCVLKVRADVGEVYEGHSCVGVWV